MNNYVLIGSLLSWAHAISPAAYTQEDYRTYCAMRYIADLFFISKTEINTELRENHSFAHCAPPLYWSRDCRSSPIHPRTNLNLTSGLIYAPKKDTLYCRFGSWTFSDQKKYLQLHHYTRDNKGEKTYQTILYPDKKNLRWMPIYKKIAEHIVAIKHRQKGASSSLYAITQAGGILLSPPTFIENERLSEIISLWPIQTNSSCAASSSSGIHTSTIIPPIQAKISAKRSFAIWQALKNRYES